MSDGFLFWYEGSWSGHTAALRIAALDAAGLSLAHPRTGRITAISSDLDTIGDQIDISRADLIQAAALDDADEVSFQYWLDDDTDVFCTIRHLPYDQVVHRLYLDGLTHDQQNTVTSLVVDQIERSPATFGLIMDRKGNSANIDWDAIAAGAPETVTVLPDLVALQPAVANRHPELQEFSSRPIGFLTCYDITAVLRNA